MFKRALGKTVSVIIRGPKGEENYLGIVEEVGDDFIYVGL